jgi:hypothetical protein
MTNDKAIERLKAFRDYLCGGNPIWDVDECREAFDIALAAMEQKWIPIKTRPMDAEERAEWSEKLGYDIEYEDAVIYTSQLPDDGQEVFTCSRWGNVRIDKFENDPDYGCSFEENGDMDGIVAWMPLPEPWKGKEDE